MKSVRPCASEKIPRLEACGGGREGGVAESESGTPAAMAIAVAVADALEAGALRLSMSALALRAAMGRWAVAREIVQRRWAAALGRSERSAWASSRGRWSSWGTEIPR